MKGRQSALRTRGPALTQYIPNLRRAGDAPRKATSNADNGNELGIDKAITRIIDSEKKEKRIRTPVDISMDSGNAGS